MKLTRQQRGNILSELVSSRKLFFSHRLAVAEEFQDYCSAHGQKVCTENFLAWLTLNELGKKILKVLLKEANIT